MVMGRDTCSKGCEFESQQHILDGHFFTFICCKNRGVFEKTNINKKESGVGPFFLKKKTVQQPCLENYNHVQVLLITWPKFHSKNL